MSEALDAVSRGAQAALAEDVRRGLSRRPFTLPAKYFYDDLGSALFDAICRLPWYGLTRAELALLGRHAREIADVLEDVSLCVELGPGNGEKLLHVARALGRPRLHLVDLSESALAQARANLRAIPGASVTTDTATYEDGLARLERGGARRALFLFLGSNIGNFEPDAAAALLGRVREAARPGDALLLGTDLVKPEAELLAAYDDPLGVTAAFNKNLLARLNRELGAGFDLARFAHRAVWNARARRVEMHLVSASDQRVAVPLAGITFEIRARETIWTENSYKFTPRSVDTLLARAGFRRTKRWIEDELGFALTLAAV